MAAGDEGVEMYWDRFGSGADEELGLGCGGVVFWEGMGRGRGFCGGKGKGVREIGMCVE